MLDEHLGYVSDKSRLSLFRQALTMRVNHGSRVMDLGCGTGILGLLALEVGASHVTGIDETRMCRVAEETYSRAGLEQKTSFHQASSFQVILAQPVDLIVCDHVGYFGFDYGIEQMLHDARHRFLRPGGHIIPEQITLYMALAETAAEYDKAHGWNSDSIPKPLRWLDRVAINTKYAINLTPDSLLSSAARLGTIDLHEDSAEYRSWSIELKAERDGLVHGLLGWFECLLAPGVMMTNSPLSDQAIKRSQAFFPLSSPTSVKAGDLVKVTIMNRPAEMLVGWTTEFPLSGQRFQQSTLDLLLLTSEELISANPERIPILDAKRQATQLILSLCDGKRSIQDICHYISQHYPNLLPTDEEVERHVWRVLGAN